MIAQAGSLDVALEVHGLCKSFGRQQALRGVDLLVRDGERLAIFGPNGAGKTTLLRILAGLARPTSGQARLWGVDLRDQEGEGRRRIGLVSHGAFLYQDLTVAENLGYYGQLYATNRAERGRLNQRIAELIEWIEMDYYRDRLVRTLSRGMQQRVSLARAMVHDPALLLLDEPYAGLDPRAAALLDQMLERCSAAGQTMLFTSHDLERGARLAQRIAILHRGRIVHETTAEAWQGALTYERYTGAEPA
ncbi:MAG: heme ABC exporter ATP-binding protein CcmA [Chloroflexi bacterium]|nr:heme ABC exporter ATP-binding protein CcmA [Chloroflexota bacterium]